MIYRTIAAAVLMLGVSPAAWAAEHWTATSTTASSITGDVTLDANKITFAGGKSLPIARVKNTTFAGDTGQPVTASLYRVTTPDNPGLTNGNQLCDAPVTYVVIWHVKPIMPGQTEGRAFAAYSGPNEPQPSARGSCGT